MGFKRISKLLFLFVGVLPLSAYAQEDADTVAIPGPSKKQTTKRINLHFQTTYIYQYKPAFDAPYTGPNSLKTEEEKENSITTTLFFGARLWKGAELYINPEVAGGSGLSGAFGVAANSNGETFRVGDPEPTVYLGRAYLSQTFQMGKAGETDVPETVNETGGLKPDNYLKLLLGKFCIGDLFDNNAYANSPRTQFMNWCLMNNGAWDYAANVRGYTLSFAAILQQNKMTYKAALATLPKVANGADLNTNLNEEYSINVEAARAIKINNKPGNVRLLGYHNSGHMGNYQEAIQFVTFVPDITLSRAFGRTKTGFGLSADQQVGKNIGVFVRGGWNDGKTETWCYTEADLTVSGGVAINGNMWKRKDDNLSFAIVMNGLSKDHRTYLADGGLGFQLGDGRLTYANETAAELYYSYKPFSHGIWFTGDYQFILNPGYNSDRGPVNVFSLRVHVEL